MSDSPRSLVTEASSVTCGQRMMVPAAPNQIGAAFGSLMPYGVVPPVARLLSARR